MESTPASLPSPVASPYLYTVTLADHYFPSSPTIATTTDLSRGPVQFLYSNLRGFCRTRSQTAVEFCADSGAPICLLREDIYQKYFSHVDRVQLSPQHYIQLRGIGVSGPVATSYIELPVTLQSTKNVTSVFLTQVHLVDSLACPLLLGVPFLKGHQLHIQWGPAGAPDHLVSPAFYHFKVLSQALPQRRKRAMLYATEAVTVLPGEGRNIRVNPRRLAASTRPAVAPAAPPAAQLVRAYLAKAFDTAADEDSQNLVKVDEETFAASKASTTNDMGNGTSGLYGATRPALRPRPLLASSSLPLLLHRLATPPSPSRPIASITLVSQRPPPEPPPRPYNCSREP